LVAAGLAAGLVGESAARAENAGRVAVLFGAKGPYRTAADALAQELKAAGRECDLIELPEGADEAARQQVLDRLAKSKPALVAAGGATATAEALRVLPTTPVVFFMVPNALDAPFLAPDYAERRRLAGVTSDISPTDQFDWIAKTRPETKIVGVLSSPRTERTVAALEKAGQQRGITVTRIAAAQDKFPDAIDALNASACQGVLMVPDAQVYNSPNVERLLLWGVRGKKPIWAFSENVVGAGAFAGVYCDPPAVGKQTAGVIVRILKGTDIATVGLQYPQGLGDAVRGAINLHTAEKIGAAIDDRMFAGGVARVGGQ
jgi:putative tryptophan/tyrosine transport system substrate-binding protein